MKMARQLGGERNTKRGTVEAPRSRAAPEDALDEIGGIGVLNPSKRGCTNVRKPSSVMEMTR